MRIDEIKSIMTDAFISNSTIKSLYGLEDGKTFDEQFSKVSLESILFYTVASAMWLFYKLLNQHKADVREIVRDNKAHTPHWYATRAKEFQYGYNLSSETDLYDNTGLTDEQIAASQIIKFAAATETSDQSVLYLKIATESGDEKQPVGETQLAAFEKYISRIKDAGVRIAVRNVPGDDLRLEMDIYYNPLILDSVGRKLDGTNDEPVQTAIRNYISSLSFNGFYINQSLVDALQVIEGVEIAELKSAAGRRSGNTGFTPINTRSIPYAGYYQISNENLILNFISND